MNKNLASGKQLAQVIVGFVLILLSGILLTTTADAASWQIQSSIPGLVEWEAALHPPLAIGNYLKIGNHYYFVSESGAGSYQGPTYNWAKVQESDQSTGSPLFDPANPSMPSRPDSTNLNGVGELFASFPSAAQGWSVFSVQGGKIDWPAADHGQVSPGSYLVFGNQLYYVISSSQGSWSGAEYVTADLAQCNQTSGAVIADPASPSNALRPQLSGLNGQPIQLVTVPQLLDNYSVTASASGYGTIFCESPVPRDGTGSCTIVPEPGYILTGLQDNGQEALYRVQGGSFTIPYIRTAHSVSATFGLKPYQSLWKRDLRAFSFGEAITMDHLGNTLVAGTASFGMDGNIAYGGSDLFITKYAPTGTRLWTRQFGSSAQEYVAGIAVDGAGTIFIAGNTSGSFEGAPASGGTDLFLMKLDQNGNKLWSRVIAQCSATRMTVGTRGDVFLLATTQGKIASPTASGEILTMRYDTNGNRVWASQHALGTSATALAVDEDDSLFIAGQVNLDYAARKNDLYIARISSQGSKLWSFTTGTNDDDEARGIALSRSGSLYLLTNYAVVRNNRSGTFFDSNLWRSGDDRAITIGTDGNLYLAGITSDGRSYLEMMNLNHYTTVTNWLTSTPQQVISPRIAIVAQDAVSILGSQQEMIPSEGNSYAFVMRLAQEQPVNTTPLLSLITAPLDGSTGALHSLTVTGSAENSGQTGIARVELSLDNGASWQTAQDTSGNGSWSTWQLPVTMPGDGSYVIRSRAVSSDGVTEIPAPGIAITIDTTGPVPMAIPAGGSYTSSQVVVLRASELTEIHYTLDGSDPTLTSPVYGVPLTISSTTTLKYMAIDALGNAGQVMTEEYTVLPAASWVRQFGGTSSFSGKAAIRDHAGNLYTTGSAAGAYDPAYSHKGGDDAYLLKYDADGNRLWIRQMATAGFDYGSMYQMAVDEQDNILLLVRSNCNLVTQVCAVPMTYTYATYLLKYSPAGDQLLAVDLALDSNASIRQLLAAPDGSIFLVGSQYNLHTGAPATNDTLLLKYDSAGQLLWNRQFPAGVKDYYQYGTDGALAGDGSIYLTGTYGSYYTGNDHFLLKASADGTQLWKTLGGYSSVSGDRIALDASGNFYLAGSASAGIDGNTSRGGSDLYLAKYDSLGARLWSRMVGSSGNDTLADLTVDADGNATLGSMMYGEVHGISNAGQSDIMIVTFDTQGTRQWSKSLGSAGTDTLTGIGKAANGDLFVSGTSNGSLDGVPRSLTSPKHEIFWAKLATPEPGSDSGVPPETVLTVTPPSVTNELAATFQFSADDPAATFECRLDSGLYQACSSPYDVNVMAWGRHLLDVRARTVTGTIDPSPARHEWTATPLCTLSVQREGTGTGRVMSSPAGIDLTASLSAQAQVTSGALVTLTATPDSDALFAGWSGACSGLDSCAVSIKGWTTVTATFNRKPLSTMGPVRIIDPALAYYLSHQSAYNAAQSGSSATIQSSTARSVENLQFNRDIAVHLKGGYDQSFTSLIGLSEITGSVTITAGSLVIDGVSIR